MAAIPSGVMIIKRWDVPKFEKRFEIPSGVSSLYLQNTGLSDARIRIDGQGKDNFFTLKAGEKLPPVNVESGKILIFSGLTGCGILEAMFWG